MQQSAANLHQMDLVGVIVPIMVHSQQSTLNTQSQNQGQKVTRTLEVRLFEIKNKRTKQTKRLIYSWMK